MEARLVTIASILFVCVAAPVPAETVVRWATPEACVSWDPHSADISYSAFGHQQVYDRLVLVDSRLAIGPGLAVSWELVAPDRWRLELRKNVRFHDGTPLTAEDVAFSLERARAPATDMSRQISSVAKVRVAGPTTVEVDTTGPDPLLPIHIRAIAIMSAKWARQHGVAEVTPYSRDHGTYARDHAMGTGAFQLETATAGGPATLVRNADWWGLENWPHQIDRIVWTPIPDNHARAIALMQNEADFAQDLLPGDADAVGHAGSVRLESFPELRVQYLGFNEALEELPGSDLKGGNPFRDRRVREAVYRAIDVDALIARAETGFGLPAAMLVVSGINGWSEELDRRLPYDPALAQRLLAEAGYGSGFAVPLLCQISHEAACRIVAEQVTRIGIRAHLDLRPVQEFYAAEDQEASGFWLDSIGNGTFDSDFILRGFYHTGGWPEAKGYANAELDALVDAVGTELSTYARDGLIEQVWRQVLPDVTVVPLYRRKILTGMRDWLEIPVNPMDVPYFREAQIRRGD